MISNGPSIAEALDGAYTVEPGHPLASWQPNHRRLLAERGIRPETAIANRMESVSDFRKLGAYLNRKWSAKQGGALVIPYLDENGDVGQRRARPDNPPNRNGKPAKYLSATGAAAAPYFPAGVRESFGGIDQPRFLTEGEFKALAMTQAGFPAISIPGVATWHEKQSSALRRQLERLEWQGRTAYLVFDSDAATNPNVSGNLRMFAAALAKHGAKVKVVWLPAGPNGEKQGADDFLVRHGASEFQTLVNAAETPEPVDAGQLRTLAKEADPSTEAKDYLDANGRNLKAYRGTFFDWHHGAYREVMPSDVRADLVRFASKHLSHLSGRITGDFVDHVKAQSHLPSWIEPPTWLDASCPWPADEILATRSKLIHLPSIVAGKDYSRPATPTFFATNALQFDFAPQAAKPAAWFDFLQMLWGDDPQSIEILQMWAGYLLVPDTRQQKILLLVGPKRSGKGTLFRILAALVGRRNVCGPTLSSLACNFGLQPLLHKTVAMISDARLSGRTDSSIVTERLLSISGEDTLTIDCKHREAVTCKLATRLMLATNELPRLSDASGALASRFIVLRLKKTWFGIEDTSLSDKLMAELPGVLLWAMHGWKLLRDRGRFPESESADGLRLQLNDLTSPVGTFVRDECVVDESAKAARADLYQAFVAWAKTAGRAYVEDEAGFGRHLRAAVPTIEDRQFRINGRPVRHYSGIGLASATGETCF